MKEIKYIVSLGTLCHTAREMQRILVKKVSYPFDWMFTDEKILIDVLEDDFNKFMDKSYYQDVAHKFIERSCGHSFYHEDFFFHKNPRNDDDYQYYQRCIGRFKDMLKDDGDKLFILMYSPQSTKHPSDVYKMFEDNMSKKDIIINLKERGHSLNNILMKHTHNYKLLVVMNFGDNVEQSFTMEHDSNIRFLTLNTLSQSTGVTFKDNNDNLFFDNLFISGTLDEHFIN
jgi:hypothetical protein